MEVVAGLPAWRRPGAGAPRWVLLHGFLGGPESFVPLAQRLPRDVGFVALTVPGHGRARPCPDTFEGAVDLIAAAIRTLRLPAPPALLGYSLGGRLAYGLLARHPELVRRVVSVGGHPGLTEAAERVHRRAQDAALATRLLDDGLPAFVDRWAALPLFASQARLAAARQAAQRRTRLDHDPVRVAQSLRRLSLGAMPNWRPALSGGRRRLDLVVGAQDAKFRGVLGPFAARTAQASLRVVEGAGHNVVMESPEAVVSVMLRAEAAR